MLLYKFRYTISACSQCRRTTDQEAKARSHTATNYTPYRSKSIRNRRSGRTSARQSDHCASGYGSAANTGPQTDTCAMVFWDSID